MGSLIYKKTQTMIKDFEKYCAFKLQKPNTNTQYQYCKIKGGESISLKKMLWILEK